MNAIYKTHDTGNEELDNLRINIYKKLAQQNIKLPKLAELIGIPHASLWRITNEGFHPNMQSLYPIAKYFGVSVADLLKSPDLPQYIPIISIEEIERYINDKLEIDHYDTVLSNEYIHEQAFGVNLTSKQYGISSVSTLIFRPAKKLNEENLGIVYYLGKYYLVKITHVSPDQTIEGINLINEESLQLKDDYQVIAIAVKQILENDLI